MTNGREYMNPLFLVPKCKSDVLVAMGIADTSNAVFSPAVCSLARLVVREVYIGVSGLLRYAANPSTYATRRHRQQSNLHELPDVSKKPAAY